MLLTEDGSDPVCTPDGREILFIRSGDMWCIPASGAGSPHRLASLGDGSAELAIARDGDRLVYSQRTRDRNIWSIVLSGPEAGQRVDLTFMGDSKVKTTKRGSIAAAERSMATNVAGIYAGGDVARGQGLMIEAIADGRNAAVAIDCYLRGVELPPEPPKATVADIEEPAFQFHLREYRKEERNPTEAVAAAKRKSNFKEINLGFADKAICVTEARRCLTCRCSAVRY